MNESPVRALFPIVDECLFLDHARVAPISTRVEDAIVRFASEATHDVRLRYPYWNERAAEVRKACGSLVGASPDQVAFVKNTSEALSFVAEGLDWRSGDVVLTADREFPSNVYPWLGLARLGVETRLLAPGPAGVTPDDVVAALDGRVRVVALSAISYGAGERIDLAAIGALCRQRDLLFVVDGIQAIGAIELDMTRDGMDCVAADGHKWLCAPEGGGFMALSDRLLARLRPVQLGWKSVMNAESYYPYDLSPRRDAAKLEAGSLGLLGLHALGAAVDLVLEVGVATIESRLAELIALLEDGCARRGLDLLGHAPGERRTRASGIVNFVPKRAPERVRQDLWARGVASTVRFGGIRLSPHHYQDDRDVESFFARLDDAEASAQ
jgi:selenocysteine lyase/cysteine desulfurase